MDTKPMEQDEEFVQKDAKFVRNDTSSSPKASATPLLEVIMAAKKTIPTICGIESTELDGKVVVEKEIFRMEIINAKLKFLPEVQSALNIQEAKSCTDARAFIQYMEAHPEKENLFEPPQRIRETHPISLDSSLMDKVSVPLEKTAIYGAIGASNKQGVVQTNTINGIYKGCTGYMITLNAMVTAAHCVDDFITSGSAAWATASIQYFDPNSTNSPSSPRTVANNETVYIWMSPTYAGTGDTQSDIAIIRSNSNWYGTSIYDMVRIYDGPFSNARYNYLWGRGYNATNSTGNGTLRYEYMYIEWFGDYHFYTLANNHRTCNGDSGGPRFRNDAHQNFTLGHHSNSEKNSSNDACAAQGGKERSLKLPPKVDWIEDMLAIECYSLTTYSDDTPYRQCFQSW